jgi:hypothetical protein
MRLFLVDSAGIHRFSLLATGTRFTKSCIGYQRIEGCGNLDFTENIQLKAANLIASAYIFSGLRLPSGRLVLVDWLLVRVYSILNEA